MLWYRFAQLRSIALNETEQKIFGFIKQFLKDSNIGDIPRVAGGWVRDKLLGKPSDDIDIVLGTMTGMQFANLISQYAKRKGINEVSAAHEISARPEQSKHLETATMKMFGLKVEFVNLRTESYGNIDFILSGAQNVVENKKSQSDFAKEIRDYSRIPKTMAFAPSLEDDAERRDLTINALYYNILDDIVEDPTGMGIDDLRNKIIRTPGNPIERMAEDPLRALRAVRFASKMGFRMNTDLKNALSDKRTHLLFDMLITPERKQEEIKKIMVSKDPAQGVRLLQETGLLGRVFQLPKEYQPWEMDQQSIHHQYNVIEHTVKVIEELDKRLQEKGVDDKTRLILNLSALLHDVGKLDPSIHGVKEVEGKQYKTYHQHEKSGSEIVEKLMKDLKFSNDEIEAVKTVVAWHMEPHEHNGPANKRQLAKFVQETGDLWENIVELGIADAKATGKSTPEEFERKEQLRQRIHGINPDTVRKMRPLLSGNQIMKLLNIQPGKGLGDIISNLKEWQLQYYLAKGNMPTIKEEEDYVINKFLKPFLSGNEIMSILHIEPGKLVGEISRDLLQKQKSKEIINKEQATEYIVQKYLNKGIVNG